MSETDPVRLEREVIAMALNRFLANAKDLGDREQAAAFEVARNFVLKRQMDNRSEP